MSKGKYTVLRSGSPKLKDLPKDIQSLYDQKMVAVTKAEEENEEQAQQTQSELIKTMC